MYNQIPTNVKFLSSVRIEHEQWAEDRKDFDVGIKFKGTKIYNAVTLSEGKATASYNTCLYLPVHNDTLFEALYIRPKFRNLDYISMLETVYRHSDVPEIRRKLEQVCLYSRENDKDNTYLIPVPEEYECIFLPFLITRWALETDELDEETVANIESHLNHIPHGAALSQLLSINQRREIDERIFSGCLDLVANLPSDKNLGNDAKAINKILDNYDGNKHVWYLPQFWISMPYLFELFFYSLCLEQCPTETILYQHSYKCGSRSIRPDFLFPQWKCIVDTKYKEYKDIDLEDMKSMALYSISNGIRKRLGIADKLCKSVFVYHDKNGHDIIDDNFFDNSELIGGLDNIRTYGIKLPYFD